jgi:hypothetical protein
MPEKQAYSQYMSTLVKPDEAVNTDTGDHDKFAHYAERGEVVRAYIEGIPIIALCGKIWVPFGDPTKYPVCQTCKEIMDALFIGEGHEQ